MLTSSDPTDGSTLQTSPKTVKLTFDQPVQNFEPIVAVIGPDGQHFESGEPNVDSTVVTAGVGELPVTGAYVIAWRVVSADGHPVQGEIHFQVTTGAVTGTGSGSPAGSTDSAAGSADATNSAVAAGEPSSTIAVAPASSSGLSGWVWAALVLVGVLVAAAIFVIVRPREPQ